MGVEPIDHVQLAMPAGREEEAREFYDRVYAYDPFGNRLELLEPIAS